MNYPTLATVEDFVRSLLTEDYKGQADMQDRRVGVILRNGTYVIEIAQMYEYVPVNFAMLCKLSEFFNTKNINDSRYSRGGCETCDYGSSYEVTLTVAPEEEE